MIIFIKYNEENFIMSRILEYKGGVIPLDGEIISLENYPNLAKKLVEGEVVYIDYRDGYLGVIKREGAYGEQEIFCSEYEAHDREEQEVLLGLDKSIKKGNQKVRKLVRVGVRFEQ